MRFVLSPVALAAVLSALAAVPVSANDKDDCYSRVVDRVIKGCTRIIDGRRVSRADLAEAYAARAGGHFDNRDYEAATADVARAIEVDANNGLAWAWRGHLQSRRKQWQAARDSFDKAVRLNPKDAGAWEGRALARIEMEDAQGALQDADRALALDPKVAVVYVWRARARMQMTQYEAAMGDFMRAAAVDDKLAVLYLHRAELNRRIGKPKEARADVDRSIVLDGEEAAPLLLRGQLKGEDGDTKGAIADLSRAVALAPSNGAAQAARALYALADGDIDGSLRHAGRAISLGHVQGYEVRALAYQAMGDHVQAISDFKAMLDKARGDSIGALAGRAASYRATGFHNEAKVDLERAIKLKAVMPREHAAIKTAKDMLAEYRRESAPAPRGSAASQTPSPADLTRQPLAVNGEDSRSKGERLGRWTIDVAGPTCAIRLEDKGRQLAFRRETGSGITLSVTGAPFGIRPGGLARIPAISFSVDGRARIAPSSEPVIVTREGRVPVRDIEVGIDRGLMRQLLDGRGLAITANGRTERFDLDDAVAALGRFDGCTNEPRQARVPAAAEALDLQEFAGPDGAGDPGRASGWVLMGNSRIGYCVLRQTLTSGYVEYRRRGDGTILWTWSDPRLVGITGGVSEVTLQFDESAPVAWKWLNDVPDKKRVRLSAPLTLDWLAGSLSRFDRVRLRSGVATAVFSYQGFSRRLATLARCSS